MIYYTQTPDFYNDYIAHHGIKGMRWGIRRYQNDDGSITSEGKRRYYIKKKRFGGQKIVDQYGKKMRRRDRRYMEKQLKRESKEKGDTRYKEYKKAKIKANYNRTYKGYQTLLSKHISKQGKQAANEILVNYANDYLNNLSKKGRKKP